MRDIIIMTSIELSTYYMPGYILNALKYWRIPCVPNISKISLGSGSTKR